MKRLIPSLPEFAILGTFSLLCAVIAYQSTHWDLTLSLMALPMFVIAAIMGVRRHDETLALAAQTVEAGPVASSDAEAA